jgi:hypothetical protein
VNETARLLTAAHLGLSATAALLLAAVALAARHPRRTPLAATLLLVCVAAIVAAVLRAESRAATALDGLALLVVAALALAVPRVREVFATAPAWAFAAVASLRLAGLDALLAARGGWMPAGASQGIAALEVASALCAVAAAAMASRRPAWARALAGVSVAGAAATVTVVLRGVRPLPMFAALYAGPFLGICAASLLISATTLRTATSEAASGR